MNDPEWLTTARAKGLIIREGQSLASSALAPLAPTPTEVVSTQKAARSHLSTSETLAPSRMVLEIDVPVRLASEANTGGKLGAMIKRKSAVKSAIKAALPKLAEPFPLPVVVTITRLGGSAARPGRQPAEGVQSRERHPG